MNLNDWVEIQQFGWNAITISAIATMIFSVGEAWGIYKQNKKVWKKESGLSISISWFIYFMFMLASFFVYGFITHKIAIMFNGLVFIFVIPLVVGLWKFKGFTIFDYLIFAITLFALLIMIFLPIKPLMFLLFSLGSIACLTMQPIEMWKTKKVGAVEIRLIWVYFMSTCFWIIYAFFVWDLLLLWIMFASLIVLSFILFFYYLFKKEEKQK